MSDVVTALPLEVFTQNNFVADFFRQIFNFTGKTKTFSPALTVEALLADISQNCGVLKVVVHSERKGEGVVHQRLLPSEN